MVKGEKFLSQSALGALKNEWKMSALEKEKIGYVYQTKRRESHPNDRSRKWCHNTHERLENMHEISFIKEIIPRLIAQKKKEGKGEKVKILDVGGGIGFYTDQIRQLFGNSVEVYSTGLSKKAARTLRKDEKLGMLHQNDLKWRSILQLRDYPEFDLIIDTAGEQFYKSPDVEHVVKYLDVVVRKLQIGGMASISPYIDYGDERAKKFLENKEAAGEIRFNFVAGNVDELGNFEILRIYKIK